MNVFVRRAQAEKSLTKSHFWKQHVSVQRVSCSSIAAEGSRNKSQPNQTQANSHQVCLKILHNHFKTHHGSNSKNTTITNMLIRQIKSHTALIYRNVIKLTEVAVSCRLMDWTLFLLLQQRRCSFHLQPFTLLTSSFILQMSKWLSVFSCKQMHAFILQLITQQVLMKDWWQCCCVRLNDF